MKVLHLITGMAAGGAEHMLYKVLPSLEGEHFVVSLMNIDFWGTPLKKRGIEVKFLDLKKFNILSVTWRLMKIIKKEKPDIINCYLLHTNIYGRFIGKLFRKKVVCSVRNIHRDRFILNYIDRITQWLVDVYTPNSEAVKDWLVNEVHISSQKVKVIPNFVNTEEIEKVIKKLNKNTKRKELKIPSDSKIITYVASFKKQKAHEELIQAMNILKGMIKRRVLRGKDKGIRYKTDDDLYETQRKSFKTFRLLLIGDGVLKERVQSLVKKLGLKNNVLFLGTINDAWKILSITDVFAFPSHHEGMSNALMEAAIAKVPIVCSEIPENRAVVGSHAVVVPINDPPTLAKRIYETIIDKNSSEKIAKLVNRYVKSKYSKKKTIQKLENIYSTLLNKK